MTEFSVELTGFEEAERKLDGLALDIQSKVLEKAMRAAVRPVQRAAQRYVTQPGYPGDKSQEKNLRSRIKVKLFQGQDEWIASVRPRVPHAYNVEHGHEGPSPAPPHPYMEPAIAAKGDEAERIFIERVTTEVEKLWQT